jgi:hypothetical protein
MRTKSQALQIAAIVPSVRLLDNLHQVTSRNLAPAEVAIEQA